MTRQRKRSTIEGQRLGQIATSMMNLGQAPDRRKVFRSGSKDQGQLGLGPVQLSRFDERTPERDPGRKIPRMPNEPGPADGDRFSEITGAPVFLAQLGERNRRRVFLDPPSQLLDARVIGHGSDVYGATVTSFVVVPVCPTSSVTFRTTE